MALARPARLHDWGGERLAGRGEIGALIGNEQIYLYGARKRVPAQLELKGAGRLRVVPSELLRPEQDYHLVIDAYTEITVHAVEAATETPLLLSSEQVSGGIRLCVDKPIHAATLHSGGIHLVDFAGAQVRFTTRISLEGKQVTVVRSRPTGAVTISIDGIESRSGTRLPARVLRP